jgi:DNA repair exonuclease SbcCD nuclease subunit
MRFGHFADCHLGSWRHPELQQVNLESFKKAIEMCIEEKVEFIIFAGDLFDSAYPPIEVLKETFSAFKRLKENRINCYIIAGSHDYSVSGKTFLDVLEKAGFCEICQFCLEGEKIKLLPCNYQGILIYGYPGKKSGLEVDDLKRIFFDETNNYRILALHTTMESARGTLPVESVNINELPKADYYALGHLHLIHEYKIDENKYLVYPGPIFPNNFQELEDLRFGSFYLIDVNGFTKITKKEIKIRDVEVIKVLIDNGLTATDKIIENVERREIKDKIVLLKLMGSLKEGKTGDINFQRIQDKIKEKGAFVMLKNTSQLKTEETEIEINTENLDNAEDSIVEGFAKENSSEFNKYITQLMNSFSIEKQEDEKSNIFEARIMLELNKILNLNLK